MTKAQKLLHTVQKRVSEHTSKFALLEKKADRTAAEQSEFEQLDGVGEALQVEYRDAMDAVEVEADASIVKDGKTDGESRERLELRDKSLVGEFQSAALGGRSVVGAELEYSQAMGCPAGHMPLTIFDSGRPLRLEHRDVHTRR